MNARIYMGLAGVVLGLFLGVSLVFGAPYDTVASDRMAYRAHLTEDLAQQQALLSVQRKLYDQQQKRLTDLRGQLETAASKPPPSPEEADASGSDGLPLVPETIRLSRSYDYEIYRTTVLRQAVAATQGRVEQLQGYLDRVGGSALLR